MQPSHEESINGSYVPVFVDALKVKREKLMDFLRNEGIFTKPYFDKNLAFLADYQKYKGCFSNTDLLAQSVMCLPIHSEMTFHDVAYICDKIEKFLSEYDYEE
jgi:dTDP-4-amino-4,6-dideoxygalactose transaminase